eukprot:3808449-Karenia_brevis.AAC.1
MTADEENAKNTYKEDEGKRHQQDKQRKKKVKMSELSPAREVTKAEDVIITHFAQIECPNIGRDACYSLEERPEGGGKKSGHR